MTAAALRFDGIGKTFPGVKALDGICFTAHPGQVHALMGENGAGKSTLLKILGGAYIPSSGTLQIGEQTMAFKCAADSIASGVAVIHQELHLVPEMSVAENLFLGHLPTRFGVVNRGLLRKQALACSRAWPMKSTRTRSSGACPWASANWWKSPRRCPVAPM